MVPYDPDRALPAAEGRALLARIAGGDESALEDFYRGYQSSVYRFACALLDDGLPAAEVLDAVMMQVWREARRGRAADDPHTWVLELTYACALRMVPARQDAPPLATAAEQSTTPTPSDAGLLQRLQDLPSGLRAVLHLALAEDLPVPRVAGVLGCDEQQVRHSLRAAQAHLRSSLAGASP